MACSLIFLQVEISLIPSLDEFLFTFASMRTFCLEHLPHLCSEVETMAFINQAGLSFEWVLCTMAHLLLGTQVKMDLNNVFQQPSPYGWRSALVCFQKCLIKNQPFDLQNTGVCVATQRKIASIS